MMYNILPDTRWRRNATGMRFESTIDINAPVKKVWALIDKLEEWPQWMPSIKKIERVSQGALTAGSQLSVTAKVSGLTVQLLMTITEFVAERNVVLEGKKLGAKLTRFYALEPVNGKTKVTIGGDVSGALAWLACRGGQKVSAEIGLAVKTRIEGSK
jgi:carbon monoxide dehydrogenase subunit G